MVTNMTILPMEIVQLTKDMYCRELVNVLTFNCGIQQLRSIEGYA